MDTVLLLGVGGFLGANARHWLSVWIASRLGSAFPWATLLVNISGSLLLAVFIAWAGQRAGSISPQARYLVATGFFGAYTTYSTFANDSIALIQRGEWGTGLAYIIGTNLLCLGGAALGIIIGSRL